MPNDAVLATHVCHWQNCHRIFASMPDLLGHVAADHLGAAGFTSSSTPTPPVTTVPTTQLQSVTNGNITFNVSGFGGNNTFPSDPLAALTGPSNPFNSDANQEILSCLWDDCFPLPECTAPAPESCPTHSHMPAHPNISSYTPNLASGEPFSPQTMLRHVLEEHLGVPGSIIGWEDHNHPIVPQSTREAVTKAHDQLHRQQHQHHQLPTPSSTHHTPSPPPNKVPLCLWPGCAHSEPFSDPATLMAHLAEHHVGKGKDAYTCLWDGCDRTFRSRQKVLRHLQSHTGHRPFVCPVCEQAFGEAAPLAAHMRRHAKESECN